VNDILLNFIDFSLNFLCQINKIDHNFFSKKNITIMNRSLPSSNLGPRDDGDDDGYIPPIGGWTDPALGRMFSEFYLKQKKIIEQHK
jgi:hypothetical protein